jgi:hypothetical protein
MRTAQRHDRGTHILNMPRERCGPHPEIEVWCIHSGHFSLQIQPIEDVRQIGNIPLCGFVREQ